MTAKKKKVSSPRDYHKSNKKGWVTRRRNARAEKLADQAKDLSRKKPTRKTPLAVLQERKRKLERQIAEHVTKSVAKTVRYRGEVWVNAHPLEFLHRDGTIAAQPSILRHYDNVAEIQKRIDSAFKLEAKNRKLPKAQRFSTDIIKDTIAGELYAIAEEYEVDVREVFTLYYSP